MKEYKKLTLFLACIVLLKIVFVFLADNNTYFSLSDLFTSVLNTDNIVSLTNASRKEAGLKKIKINSKLQSAAQEKANDMINNQYFSHTSPSGKVAWDFLEVVGYNYLFAGENLAVGFLSSEDVTDGWMTSQSHRENILNKKYTEIGIGIVRGKFLGAETTIVVQMFGNPLKATALISNVSPVLKKSLKTSKNTKNRTLTAYRGLKPSVKGISVENYIAKMQEEKLATWHPRTTIYQLYGAMGNSFNAKLLFDAIYGALVVCSICVIAFRFFKKRQFHNKFLTVATILVVGLSALLAVL